MSRLKKLTEKFPKEKEKTGGGKDQTDFAELEDTFLRRSENVKQMIDALAGQSRDTRGITESIRQKRNIQQELAGIGDCLKQMNELMNREKRRKVKNRKGQLSDEEIARRETNLQTFAQVNAKIQAQLMGERAEKFGTAQGVDRVVMTKEELLAGFSTDLSGKKKAFQMEAAKLAGIGLSAGDKQPELSEAHIQALEEFQKRDAEQDLLIEEIGLLIMEAGQIAEAIHDTVQTQNIMLADVEKQIDDTKEKLMSVNQKLKQTLDAKGMSWERMGILFCCLIVIIGLVGVIVSSLGTF